MAAQSDRLLMIVEDEYDNREILRAIVEELLGYNTLLLSDGQAVGELAAAHRPDLILMDLMMPILDGFEAIRRIKRNSATANIPIIAVTALSRPADRQRALEEGAIDYLSKPFDLEALVSLIRKYVETGDPPASQT